jgi:hypothetical protein
MAVLIMSRGHGKLQRRILELLAMIGPGQYRLASQLERISLRGFKSTGTLTESERRNFRRAMRALVKDGSVIRAHYRDGRPGRLYKLPDKSTGTLSESGGK